MQASEETSVTVPHWAREDAASPLHVSIDPPLGRLALESCRPQLQRILQDVASAFGLDPAALIGPCKGKRHVQARAIVCYRASRELGLSGQHLAALLSISDTSVSRALRLGHALCSPPAA
jgi:hypothetical protein